MEVGRMAGLCLLSEVNLEVALLLAVLLRSV